MYLKKNKRWCPNTLSEMVKNGPGRLLIVIHNNRIKHD